MTPQPQPPVPFDQLTFNDAASVLAPGSLDGKALVDVRTPEEYADGHIKGSINVPLPRFQDPAQVDQVVEELKQYKEGVVVTCFQSIKRGPTAASHLVARLKELGLDTSSVCVLKGGVEGVQNDPALAAHVEGKAGPAH
eukprot:CAMPEP_0202857676 /NCGR_PEP_ID=MMETSP1391-20130828/524_1 /ASSEMBLY_ACC=CAM_ASM_000867 /TAXON_ID=1034604 /ORGANISM="Chlamydomonas leiostraca, Strain SAG 11-49" /LENGTH=138 /DNA_ID=CAMNT_0049536507 /DNA_START=74 /DNA_END=490 /DNA_ORIENTATION=+